MGERSKRKGWHFERGIATWLATLGFQESSSLYLGSGILPISHPLHSQRPSLCNKLYTNWSFNRNTQFHSNKPEKSNMDQNLSLAAEIPICLIRI